MNYFNGLTIQERVHAFFTQALNNDHLAHAYLFYGADGRGKTAFALYLAQALNCQADKDRPCGVCPSCTKIKHMSHPDVKYVFPISKAAKEKNLKELYSAKAQNPYKKLAVSGHLNISIEAIRALKDEAKYAPFEARKRVFIIEGIEYFKREAANSFLKLLEEPPDDLMLLLTTSDKNNLLDTIRSRCQPVLFPPFNETDIEQIVKRYQPVEDSLSTLARINDFNIARVFDALSNPDNRLRELAVNFLRAAATSNFSSIDKVVDTLAASKDKNRAIAFVEQVSLWLADAFRYHSTNLAAIIINRDMTESIQKFSAHYGDLPYDKLFLSLENSAKTLQGNGHMALTLTSLGIEFVQVFKKHRQTRQTSV